ncbi:uncharacterized protein LTR77_005066 [Saxophila tyrrhenica]|uniref:Uncharacterized protein n=1 Tax=Saxophila tyrrhenica TaxID=1690608 RepID=A0AAV9PEY5_9PEZI|nr:hypothetical protein LTR77_005066 [Saxophila tyrrhenica]
MVVLRCPADAQERLLGVLGDGGEHQRLFISHPTLIQAFFAEDFAIRSSTFSKYFAEPMYELEQNLGRSATEYTRRARRFMLMARQMGNVQIDHDLDLWSLRMLQEVYQIIRDCGPPDFFTEDEWQQLHREFDGETFQQVSTVFEYLKLCGQLYERRATIGNNEVCAPD